jgi:transcriptional regulator with XRE-family HTH domain
MSFGENLQFLRKRENITQEQMAERLEVSRQSVSKWESDTSYPEMEKLLQLCQMFDCDMDTLLRGDVQAEKQKDTHAYDQHINTMSKQVALGVGTIILGIAVMMAMEGLYIKEALCDMVMMIFVAVGVVLLVLTGMEHSRFCKKHPHIEPFYSPEEIDAYEAKFPKFIAAGVAMLLIGLIWVVGYPGLLGKTYFHEDLYIAPFMVIVAIAVALFIYAGLQKSKYNIEGYNQERKEEEKEMQAEKEGRPMSPASKACAVIMLSATIIFFILSFVQGNWETSWLPFPIGGILCAIVKIIWGDDRE